MRDITLADTFYHFFTTRAFATGIPTTLLGTPVLSVLEENNVTPITAVVSIQVDRASVVGLNQATIVATGANGFETGKSYAIYISTGTVGGVSVIGEVVGEFTIEKSAAFIRLGAPAGASVSADIAAIEAQTDDIGVAGAGLTAIPTIAAVTTVTNLTNAPTAGDLTATMKASINTEVDNALDTAIPVTNTLNSVNDILLDQLSPRLPGSGTIANTTNITAGTVTTATNVTTVNGLATDVITAASIAAAAANKIADSTLRRTYANARGSADGDAVAFRSLLGAIGKLVNKWSISGTTLTIFQEDDVTSTAPGGAQTITTDAAANPIVTLDT